MTSMQETLMGGAENEYEKDSRENIIKGSVKKCRPETVMDHPGQRKKKPVYGGCRAAAAGLAGALLTVNTVGAVSAWQRPGTADLSPSVGQSRVRAGSSWWGKDKTDQEEEGEGRDTEALNRSVCFWDEEEILDRWNLDPEDFPADEEEQTPDIPVEYVPYFQEVTSEAMAWYAGDTPPEADLSKYSPRADAIRKAAVHAAEESVRSTADRFLEISKSMISSAGGEAGQNLVGALQDGVYSRGVHAGTLVFGTNGLGHTDGPDSLMTAGKPRNDRTNGPSSVTWFLQRQSNTSLQETAADPNDPSVQTNESSDQENSAQKENSAQNENSVQKEDSARQNIPVVSPAFRYLLTAPFAYDTEPGVYLSHSPDSLPLPPGIYPYPKPDQASSKDPYHERQEQSDDGDSGSYDDLDSDGLYDDAYAEHHDPDNENNESNESTRRKLTADGNIIPFRFYTGSGDSSRDFHEGRRTIFIGDSRTVGMEMFCGGMPEEYWSAKNSMGYSWMVSTGIPNVEHLIDQNSDVVILMGVNDLGNVYRYIDHINMKAAEWKKLGARTFFVSVTPVDDSRSPNAKNSRIESFNAYAQENLQDVYYIDAYSRIRHSFGSPDGIHFDAATYREIYRIIEFSLYRGWYEQNGLWFYFDCGKPLTGWQYLNGQWQYMDGYGVRWVKDGHVGDMSYIPLPDFDMSGEEIIGLSF